MHCGIGRGWDKRKSHRKNYYVVNVTNRLWLFRPRMHLFFQKCNIVYLFKIGDFWGPDFISNDQRSGPKIFSNSYCKFFSISYHKLHFEILDFLLENKIYSFPFVSREFPSWLFTTGKVLIKKKLFLWSWIFSPHMVQPLGYLVKINLFEKDYQIFLKWSLFLLLLQVLVLKSLNTNALYNLWT